MADYFVDKVSDHVVVAASKIIPASVADGTYNVIRVPNDCMVIRVWANVITANTGTVGTASIGYSEATSDTDGLMDESEFLAMVTGMRFGNKAHKFTQRGVITITMEKDDGANGSYQIFAELAKFSG